MAQEDPKRIVELNKVNAQQLRLVALDADPVDLQDGDMWYRGDTDVLHVRVAGATKAVTVT